MDEYAAVVRKFYEVYRPIGRRYNLRVHSRKLGEEPGRRKREIQNSMRRSDCAFPCGRCLCNHCANNVETIDNCTGEAKEPCFVCDECRWYDGDTRHKDMWRQECGEYIVTNEHAERLRRKLKLITGGHTS